MRTKGRGAPDAEHPWNEIVPNLWMGGHHHTAASGERVPAIVRDEFDTVISLYQRDGHGPPLHVDHHYEGMPDGPLTAAQLEAVCRLADIAGDDAVFLIRYRRSKWALNNHLFVDYLTSGLDVARLLTGLESLP
ncbi:protein phosphatase [Actinomadura spongiicola]|uniref:Protein phosphatase n=1 Tax=Actinomadura spongiicola TaxID=2303421 RepID=A0A372GNL9_9ACTN|nr:protein phosphatase [Actinomadura spongiicola]RFS87000.1 protein phosphatase [Actinomadura spongiicola]